MPLAFQPYNITLPSFSPVLTYTPYRDGDATQGWNSSFTESTVASLTNMNGFNVGLGVAYRTTEFSGAAVNIVFEGTAIYLCLTTTDASVTYTLTVDSQTIRSAGLSLNNHPDPACAIYGGQPQALVYVDNLEYGSHSATLQASIPNPGNALNFYGGTVTVSAGSPGPKVVQVVDDDEWNYSPDWGVQTDDENMWNGKYHATADYSPQSVASYTFSGASAIILRGLSMYNYGPYNVTLDSSPGSVLNATDYYWRHSPTILYFAGGLDPTQSHTLTVTNYDAGQVDPPTDHPSGLVSASVDSLALVMDDTASRAALLASVQPPSFPPSAIAAVVLGACLALLLAFNAVACVRSRRREKVDLSRVYYQKSREDDVIDLPLPTPYVLTEPGAASHSQGQGTAFSVRPASSVPPSTARALSVSGGYAVPFRPHEKRTRRPPTAPGPAHPLHPLSSLSPSLPNPYSSPSSHLPSPPAVPAQKGEVHVQDLVEGLSRVLNGQLRREFMDREGEGGLPGYGEEGGGGR